MHKLAERLQAAVRRVRAARVEKRRRKVTGLVRRALAGVREVAQAAPDADQQLDIITSQIAALMGPSEPETDRWAVAKETAALQSEGAPVHRIARVLIETGWCKGPFEPRALSFCESKLRQEKRRFSESQAVTLNGSAPLALAARVDRLLPSSPTRAEEDTEMPKLMKRKITEEIYEIEEGAQLAVDGLDEDAANEDEDADCDTEVEACAVGSEEDGDTEEESPKSKKAKKERLWGSGSGKSPRR